MAGKAGLKAGLIGAAIMVVVTVISRLVPMAGALVYVSCGVSSLLYIGVGILAGFFLAAPRTAGKGAGAGAIAGLVSGGISGAVGAAILLIQVSRGGGIPGLDPQQMQQLAESGMDPQLLTTIGAVCGLTGGLAIGAGLAAAGGAILASLKPD